MKPFDSKIRYEGSLKEGDAASDAPPSPSVTPSTGTERQSGNVDDRQTSPTRSAPNYFSWQILFCSLIIALVFMVAISTRDMAPGVSMSDSFRELPKSDEGLTGLAVRMQLARAELQNNPAAVQKALRLSADFSLHQGDSKTAAKYLQRLVDMPLLDIEDQRQYAAPMLIQIYFDQGRLQDARKVFEDNQAYFGLHRPQLRIYQLASRIYKALGERENQKRMDILVRTIRLNDVEIAPSDPDSGDPVPAMYESARACLALGEYAKARQLLRLLSDLDLRTTHADLSLRVQLMLPVVTGLEGDYEKAAEEFAAAVKVWNSTRAWNLISPSETYAFLNTYAEVLRQTGREERASAVQRQADAVEEKSQARLPVVLVQPIRWWKTR